MKRRSIMIAFVVAISSTAPLHAADFAGDVVAQLTNQGFADISTEKTWLGRVRITADRKDGAREIVLNPLTGEILRDLWTPTNAATGGVPIVDNVGQPGDQGNSSSDDGGSDNHGGGEEGGSGGSGGSGGDGSGGSGGDGGSDD